MTSELTPWLLRLALFTTLALVLLLALRVPLRRFLGAATAYQAWLLVPLVATVACLPMHRAPVIHAAPVLRAAQVFATRIVPAPSFQVDLLLVAWAAGALVLAGWFMATHRAFRHRAGPLRREGNVYFSERRTGPASVGLFRPKIILPHDFLQRYAPDEQALVIAHEQVHIARRDAYANLLQAAFQCIFWFNPLVHVAALRFRQDQELSCDALVMARHPGQRRCYAEALLKSCISPIPRQSGIHCHWQSRQPIKERFMQLQSSPPRLSRRIAGRCLVAVLGAGLTVGTLAARAESTPVTYSVAMAIDAGGEHASPRVLARSGEQFAVASGAWRVEMTVRSTRTAGDVWVMSKIYRDGTVVGNPTLLAHENQKIGVTVGEGAYPFSLSMVVTPQP